MNNLNIDFSRKLDYEGIKGLCRYLAFSLPETCSVELISQNGMIYGDRIEEHKPKRLEDVSQREYLRNLKAIITKGIPLIVAEAFFNEDDESIYSGMKILLAASDWDDLLKSEKLFVKEIRESVSEYFCQLA